MVLLIVTLSLFAILLIIPGWHLLRRERPQSPSLLALPVFGMLLWIALVAAGVGPQSLSNLVELFGVAAAGVAAAYVKFLALDRSPVLQSRGAVFISFAMVALVVLGLRMLMPELPE